MRSWVASSLTAIWLVFPAPKAEAAEISWSSRPYPVNGKYGETLATGIFAKDGTLALAENSGGPTVTFDGISFQAGTIHLGDTYDQYHTDAAPLSGTGTWSDSKEPSRVTIPDLRTGKTYRIQILIYDGRHDISIVGKTVRVDGLPQGTYAHSERDITWGKGLLITGIFTADSSTQSFTIETFSPDTKQSQSGQFNALLLHQLNPPHTASPSPGPYTGGPDHHTTLLGIGGLSLILNTLH